VGTTQLKPEKESVSTGQPELLTRAQAVLRDYTERSNTKGKRGKERNRISRQNGMGAARTQRKRGDRGRVALRIMDRAPDWTRSRTQRNESSMVVTAQLTGQ